MVRLAWLQNTIENIFHRDETQGSKKLSKRFINVFAWIVSKREIIKSDNSDIVQ